MSKAESESDQGKILLHGRSEFRDSAPAKTERARTSRRAEAEAVVDRLLTAARSGISRADQDDFVAAVALELVYEFCAENASIALAGTTSPGALYTTGNPGEQNGSDLAECPRQVVESGDHAIHVWRTGLPRAASNDLTSLTTRGPAVSSLRAFGYAPAERHPALSISLEYPVRRSFDPMDIAILDAVADALVRELSETPPASRTPSARP
jgi:hypothetical protein